MAGKSKKLDPRDLTETFTIQNASFKTMSHLRWMIRLAIEEQAEREGRGSYASRTTEEKQMVDQIEEYTWLHSPDKHIPTNAFEIFIDVTLRRLLGEERYSKEMRLYEEEAMYTPITDYTGFTLKSDNDGVEQPGIDLE